MESPGEFLKRERELRGVSLKSVHDAVRVPMRYLTALEADDYETLPHPAFIKGFIKTYCKHLGLDETDAVLRFEMYMREKAEKREAPQSAPSAGKAAPAHASSDSNPKVVPLLIAAASIAMLVFYLFSTRRGGKVEAPPEAGKQAANADVKSGVQQAGPGRQITMADELKSEERPVAQYPAPEKAALSKAASRHVLKVKATDTVWIKIRIDSGEPFDVILRKGEEVAWRAAEGFSVLIGNAGGVEMSFDDERITLLGKTGEVVNFVLPREAGVLKPKAQ